MHRNPVKRGLVSALAFPPCAIPIVLQAVGVLFEISTNGKGTTSSRAAPAPKHNSALAAGAASVLAAAFLRLQRMDDEEARGEAPLYASQSSEARLGQRPWLSRLARFRLSWRSWAFCLRSARTGRARLRVVPLRLLRIIRL